MKVACTQCKVEFDKVPSQIKRSINQFCSSSCAATYNNTLKPKRKPSSTCRTCGNPNTSSRTYCITCWKARLFLQLIETISIRTLGQEKSYRKYQKSSRIRDWARRVYLQSDKPKCCSICGYPKHFEVCHIKAINSFSENTIISEVNALSNLVALCPNCHWELDHGLLEGWSPS
jgi:5-methylcytosine-specific restriction endonuclease McrA